MQKRLPALDLDALRSFITGIECGSFAQAATQLCRSTSAVSAQLKKLEHQCGAALVTKKGRHLQLTSQGEILLAYGRRLLALSDEAQQAIKGAQLQGEIRIGMQEDFGESLMPGILGQFHYQHPDVRIMAKVDRNDPLQQALAEQALDMALFWQPDLSASDGKLLDVRPLEWIGSENGVLDKFLADGEPIPLVMFEHPCLMRARATAALDNAGIPWRVVFVSHSLGGIWAAVQAGLGLTVRTRVGMPANLRTVNARLPSPGVMGITLKHNPASLSAQHPAHLLLEQLIVQALAAA